MEPLGLPDVEGPLGKLLYVSNLAGRHTRGAMLGAMHAAGVPGAPAHDWKEGIDGRDMLEKLGLVGPNTDKGWIPDKGDVAGFAADSVLDPLNWAGTGAVKKIADARKATKLANAKSMTMRAMGAMPGELVDTLHSSLKDESGMPLRVYHGRPAGGLGATDLDPAKAGKNTDFGFLGKGVYFSQTPEHSNYYTRYNWQHASGEPIPSSTVMAHVYAKNPLLFDHSKTSHPRDILPELHHLTEHQIEDSPKLINDVLNKRGQDAVVATGTDPNHYEVMIPSKDQIYAPYVAPSIKELPDITDAAALILGHNTAKTLSNDYGKWRRN